MTDEIVKPKRDPKVQKPVMVLCASHDEVKRMGEFTVKNIRAFEHLAHVNFQCFLEKYFDKKEFKLRLSSTELVSWPSCNVSNNLLVGEYYITRMVVTINKDSLNRLKLCNGTVYNQLCDIFKGRLISMEEFKHSLNNSTN